MTKNVIDNVKKRIEELESLIQSTEVKYQEASAKYTEAVGGQALGTHTAKDVDAAKKAIDKVNAELSVLNEQLAITHQVKRKVTIEQLPIIRDLRMKKIKAAQKAYDEHVKRVQAKRNEWLQELAKTSKYQNEVNQLNYEMKEVMESVGERSISHELVKTNVIAPAGESPSNAMGVSESDQLIIKNGNLPEWAKE